MFTGLIQELGVIEGIGTRGSGVELEVGAPPWGGKLDLGESIAVNGCCLTVETVTQNGFTVFASPETLAKTSVSDLKAGARVNLERAMAMGDRLGGHMVSGHVDATGRLRSVTEHGQSWQLWFDAPAEILTASIPKGSIAVDGISLTLVDVTSDGFSVWIIPETWTRTTLGQLPLGARVNLESDLIGKYVRRSMEAYMAAGGRLEEVVQRFDKG